MLPLSKTSFQSSLDYARVLLKTGAKVQPFSKLTKFFCFRPPNFFIQHQITNYLHQIFFHSYPAVSPCKTSATDPVSPIFAPIRHFGIVPTAALPNQIARDPIGVLQHYPIFAHQAAIWRMRADQLLIRQRRAGAVNGYRKGPLPDGSRPSF